MEYAPIPSEEQLERVGDALGSSRLTHVGRIEGGLGCTMDVLSDNGTRMVLRRYGSWYEERGEDAAARESRALELLQRVGVPVPAPIWVDNAGVFAEQAILISHVDGAPDLTPSHPFDWAETLARVLARIHSVNVPDDDADLFQPTAGEDERKISENPEVVLEHPLGEELLRRRVGLAARTARREQAFSHSDFWPGNTMWSSEELTAVVDWEAPGISDPEMDVAYCSLDIRYFGMDKVADHFVAQYREVTGDDLPNLDHWESIALCRPMPDIGAWVPAWEALGRRIDQGQARARHTELIESFLARTS